MRSDLVYAAFLENLSCRTVDLIHYRAAADEVGLITFDELIRFMCQSMLHDLELCEHHSREFSHTKISIEFVSSMERMSAK